MVNDELIIDLDDPAEQARGKGGAQTAARIGVGRSGVRPKTADALIFQADHAVTQDALMREVDPDLLTEMDLLQVNSAVTSRQQYLKRPDLGRTLSAAAQLTLAETLPMQPDVQIFVGDGLSAAAVEHNLPSLLPKLVLALRELDLQIGQPFFVRNARVGLLNAVNGIVDARVVVVLIGERPGLARAESMSIYVGFRPKSNSTDAERNVISNVYRGGLSHDEAVRQTVQLITRMLDQEASGVALSGGE